VQRELPSWSSCLGRCPFQGVADLGRTWCVTRGGAKCTRRVRNTVKVDIMKVGRACLPSFSSYYSFITTES
jgi:hypothetical protein